MYEKRGSYQFHYRYDAFGNLAGITREDASGSLYRVYVLCNSRGDVLELRNQNGTVFAKYVYDAWGNVLHVLNSAGNEITSTTNLANQNPFRYRGYYYDSESGLYYLQSRYYDPVTGRFLNADNIVTTEHSLVGINIFAYCYNNPTMLIDPDGNCPYNGTAADFHRLEQGLPSLSCNCTGNNLNVLQSSSHDQNKRPFTGKPGSTWTAPNGDKRTFGDDSKPSRDYDHNDHGYPDKHPHDENGGHYHD